MLFSATKRQGIDDISRLLWQWAHPVTGESVDTPAASDPGPVAHAPAEA